MCLNLIPCGRKKKKLVTSLLFFKKITIKIKILVHYIWHLLDFENNNYMYMAYDRFHGSSLYGKILS